MAIYGTFAATPAPPLRVTENEKPGSRTLGMASSSSHVASRKSSIGGADPQTREVWQMITEAELDEAETEFVATYGDLYPKIGAMFAAARAHLSAGWRPIETAPKDGTTIILGSESGWSDAGFWMGNPKENYWGKTGWYAEDDRASILTAKPVQPTHWLPLPEPPKFCGSKNPIATREGVLNVTIAEQIRQAVAAEREAILKIAESLIYDMGGDIQYVDLEEAIRARTEVKG